MKTLSILAAFTLATALLSAPVRADDPVTGKLSQVRGLLDDLLKGRSNGSTSGTAPTAPASDPAAPAAPTPPATPNLSPEMISQARSLLDELRKLNNLDSDDGSAPTAPTAPATPAAAPGAHATQKAPATAQRSQSVQPSTGLTTGRLATGHLMPSAGLGGKGLTAGTPQLSDTDWRKLFPAQGSK